MHTTSTPAIAYSLVGSSQPASKHAKPRVLLVMGLGMGGGMWRPQIEGLAPHCEVLSFDHRGIGASVSAAHGPLSILDMARDASRVLDACDWHHDVHIVGVSMGGMIGQELALDQPSRFASLSLIATHAGGPLAALPTAQGLSHFVGAQLGPSRKRARRLAQLLYPAEFLKSDTFKNLHRAVPVKAPPRVLLRQLQAIAKHDTRSRLAELHLPTLVIKPALDLLVRPSNSERLLRALPNASMLCLPNAGHGVTFQCADEVNRALMSQFEA